MLSPEKQQAILDMAAAGRHNNAEIAAVVGTTKETVRQTRKRGRVIYHPSPGCQRGPCVLHLCGDSWARSPMPCIACAARAEIKKREIAKIHFETCR